MRTVCYDTKTGAQNAPSEATPLAGMYRVVLDAWPAENNIAGSFLRFISSVYSRFFLASLSMLGQKLIFASAMVISLLEVKRNPQSGSIDCFAMRIAFPGSPIL
jgi:hypothetical protein